MVEEEKKDRSAFLAFLKEHGEKAVLGIVAAGCAAYLLLGWNGKDVGAEQITAQIARIDSQLTEERLPDPPPVVIRRVGDSPLAHSPGGPDWASSLLPKWKRIPPPPPPPPPPPLASLLPRVAMGTVEAEPYAVKLTWEVTPYSRTEKSKLKGKASFPDIERFVIERAPAGTAEFKPIAAMILPDQRSFMDGTVEPEAVYVYRLTPIAEKRKTKKEDRILTAEPVTVPGIWTIRFNGPTDGMGVYVEIGKIDRKYGKVVLKKYQTVGSRLGWWANREGEEPSPRHYMNRKDDFFEVDFDTGITLESVKAVKTTIDVLQCRRKVVPPRAVVHEKITVKRPVSTFEIILLEKGERRTVYQPAKVDRDERCKKHQE